MLLHVERRIEPEPRRVLVVHGGVTVADTTRALRAVEPGWTAIYVPRDDVLVPLTPSTTSTVCGWKGTASYWSLPDVVDAAWSYDDPMDEAAALQGRVAFYASKVDEIRVVEAT
jgi:uncharacterized protein (DUF427 family)